MKVLWITNVLLPEATSILRGEKELKGTGSWVLAMAEALFCREEMSLFIASISDLVNEISVIKGEKIVYYAIPRGKGDVEYNKEYERAYSRIKNEINPDVVHIHGTEYPHSLAALRTFGADRTVVSLQGIISSIHRYYFGGISRKDIIKNWTIHDVLRPSLFSLQSRMEKSGMYEVQLFKEMKHVIGRTTWDKAQVWSINPDVHYYHCDEVLREDFYTGDIWDYNRCTSHSIFLSQGSYPLKGLHKVLDALPLIKRIYPDVSVRVAGLDITYDGTSFKDKIKISTYGRFVKGIIKKNNIVGNITFLGPLNAEQMKHEYLRANVFVCPSSIENSPNSLGEAQVLGVPCVASYAGGIPDFMKGCEDFLYRFDDIEMMSKKICNIFGMEGKMDTNEMMEVARKRHDTQNNIETLLSIYNQIKG
jgi:glycosyltransferase involved in cell wall biosynthesis